MFARVFALLPLVLLVSASKARLQARQSECSTGAATCCTETTAGALRQTHSDNNVVLDLLAGLLDSDTAYSDCSGGIVGVLNGCSAQQQPVCCNSNQVESLISVTCSPINIIL